VWPLATVQTCTVHLVRASLRYASKKHWGQISKQLRIIYTACTVDAARDAFEEFEQEWKQRYPAVINPWRAAWQEFIPFLQFPPEVRKVIYTTNMIESLNAQFRQATRRRGHFPNEQAALKVLHLVIRDKPHNRPHVTGKISGWKTALNTLAVLYGERIIGN
jgi:transposase-like protein